MPKDVQAHSLKPGYTAAAGGEPQPRVDLRPASETEQLFFAEKGRATLRLKSRATVSAPDTDFGLTKGLARARGALILRGIETCKRQVCRWSQLIFVGLRSLVWYQSGGK